MNRIDCPLNDLGHLSPFTLVSTYTNNDLISNTELDIHKASITACALEGQVTEHHRVLITGYWARV